MRPKTKIHLAATSHVKRAIVGKTEPLYLLESFMDLKADTKNIEKYMEWCLSSSGFLLDSGAYAFLRNPSKKMDVDSYIEKYIRFIIKYNIKQYFEMDIDNVVGYEMVKEIRKKLEMMTGEQSIPVWHKDRGVDEFIKTTKDYEYVAIGGIASREITRKEWGILWELCDIAHVNNCRVHGLGFLPIDILNKKDCPFDTVDGTSWQGHMYGNKYIYENGLLKKIKDNGHWKDLDLQSFIAWNDFAKEY